jgi:hypothetical protein
MRCAIGAEGGVGRCAAVRREACHAERLPPRDCIEVFDTSADGLFSIDVKILEILLSKGLMGHEKDPMASLAAYLTAFSNDFVNNGSGTWSIREPTQAPTRKPTREQAA